MVLTRSRQLKDVKATDDKPRTSSKNDEDSVTQNIGLKTRKAKPKQTASTSNEELKPQPDSTESVSLPKQDPVKDAVVIATTEDETPKKEDETPKKKSCKKRNRKRKSVDGEIKSPNNENERQTEEVGKDAQTNSNTKGETLNISSSTSSSSVKQKSNNNTSSKNETVSCIKRAKKNKRTAVDEDLQKENVIVSLTLDVEKGGEPLLTEKTEVVNAEDIMKLYKKESFIGEVTKHKGNPKSGRKWKTEQTSRSSGMKQDKPMKSSWKKKMNLKAEKKSMKLFEAELKETKSKELEKKKQHRANKIKLKLENERKSEVVQVIKNTAKMKRMKKKQLRKVEMRKIPNFNTAQIFA